MPLQHNPHCVPRRVYEEIGRINPTHRNIKVASTVVVESAEGRFLLCRRDHNSSIFPKAWVIPGGHVEREEDLEQACMRELEEETGIALRRVAGSWLYRNKEVEARPLILFESSYYETEPFQLPKAQHLIVTFHVKLPIVSSEIEVRLDTSELDMAVWVSSEDLEAIRSDMQGELDGLISQSDRRVVSFAQLAGDAPNALGEGIGLAASVALDEVIRHSALERSDPIGH
jgi:8-oxo-dGTP pyrophosphatase MutT (NUDIX family)